MSKPLAFTFRLEARFVAMAALAMVFATVGAMHTGTSTAGADVPSENPWMSRRVLGIAHAGGENENPHSTMYAFGRAVEAGVPMIDMDLQLTADGVPIVLHNDTVDRTTNGTGSVEDMTFAQVHALDAAYWFSADCWACHDKPTDAYIYRGIRTGDKPAPQGYSADDFAVPSLREVFERYPDKLMDMEIKDDGGHVLELAQKVAALIHEFHREDSTVVASFGQPGMDEFRSLAPTVATSATLNEMIDFVVNGNAPAFPLIMDVPPDYLGVTVLTPEFVQKAHAHGYAVWVWPNSRSRENADYYSSLVDMGVDGINAAAPRELMEMLDARGVAWQPPPTTTASTTSLPAPSTSVSVSNTTPEPVQPSGPKARPASASHVSPVAAAVVAQPAYTG